MKNIDWKTVDRVLVVKLRSIGDTVLATPSLIALRRFLPNARIDILLEDWVAPLLDGFDAIDNVISVDKTSIGRLRSAGYLRRQNYDVAFNLHGGTTATFFTAASGARHKIGLSTYQYSFLHNHLLGSSTDFWGRGGLHSAEQQLALPGFVGVPVDDLPKSRLAVTISAAAAIDEKLSSLIPSSPPFKGGVAGFSSPPARGGVAPASGDEVVGATDGVVPSSSLALLHPASLFFTKQWPAESFARTAEFLGSRGYHTVAVATKQERNVLDDLVRASSVPITIFDDLTLPEITALAARAQVFVGNDSGIAHIAAAVGTPSVIIFGSSNRDHWRPWTDTPNEIVFEEFACQPCPGYECKEFGEPRCILSVRPEAVFAAIEQILS